MPEPNLVPLVDVEPTEPAGGFGTWLARFAEPGSAMDVPCGDCTICCRSRLFVHVLADERDTLAAIPEALQCPAPGRPGDIVLGFDETGACPMLVDGACSIYSIRPRSCREFDCRVFAAAGRGPGDPTRRELLERASRWCFEYANEAERERHAVLRDRLEHLDAPLDGVARAVREFAAG